VFLRREWPRLVCDDLGAYVGLGFEKMSRAKRDGVQSLILIGDTHERGSTGRRFFFSLFHLPEFLLKIYADSDVCTRLGWVFSKGSPGS
jgi:hypothetical protein